MKLVEQSRLREVAEERDELVKLHQSEVDQAEALGSRLREVEAELATMERAHATAMGMADSLAGDVERLEAELERARDAFQEIAIYLHLDEGETHNADACGVDACIFCLAETRAKEGLERARGVLRKGDRGG